MPTAQTSNVTSQERACARRLNSIILIAATSHRLSRCSSDFVIQSTTYFTLLATILCSQPSRRNKLFNAVPGRRAAY